MSFSVKGWPTAPINVQTHGGKVRPALVGIDSVMF